MGEDTYTINVKYFEGTDIPSEINIRNSTGKLEAPGDMPSKIWFTSKGEIHGAQWHKNNLEHRENNLPSFVRFFEKSGKLELLQFKKYYNDYDHPCGFCYLWFNPDGTIEDENGNPIKPDTTKIPEFGDKHSFISPLQIGYKIKPP